MTENARRSENLALAFQEVLTAIVRLRSNRQTVSDASAFRGQIREAIRMAEQEARRAGYSAEDVEDAKFAVVAFLDESILNLRSPVFTDWPRRPLQEEFYGHHIAGEVFFRNLQRLLVRDESQDVADVLEVYHLCMLLGFAGRYSIGGRGELQGITGMVAAKIQRIRQTPSQLSPGWALPGDSIQVTRGDPWLKRAFIAAICCISLAIALFLVYMLLLRSGVGTIRSIGASHGWETEPRALASGNTCLRFDGAKPLLRGCDSETGA